MNRTVWFLTGNPGKVREAAHHLAPLGYDVKQLEVPNGTIVEPQVDTLEEVAQSKIEQALAHVPGGTETEDLLLVEDAGLFIDALQGFPGVYSSYALNTIGCTGVLRLLNHLESEDTVQCAQLRSAQFQAVAALWHKGELMFGHGVCQGWIALNATEGEGFGFDPIFTPYDLDEFDEPLKPGNYGPISTHGKTFGTISLEEKQKFSHRQKALNDLLHQMPSA
ncbi:MAG: non-canonical purine NTP pyrophosphatase [Euryarchaeota archaeon]|nr:non-canonical purine NTP pyrophosphatase [Euryarchaeota archaeon]